MKAALLQQLPVHEQAPLYSFGISASRLSERCLQIMEDAKVGSKALRLICAFWDKSILVCLVPGYHGSPFGANLGVTQGSPLSSPPSPPPHTQINNIMVLRGHHARVGVPHGGDGHQRG